MHEDGPIRPATLMRLRLRAQMHRKLLEALVTSACGAYAVVLCLNQWFPSCDKSKEPPAHEARHRLPV